jgi:hypothetical protein
MGNFLLLPLVSALSRNAPIGTSLDYNIILYDYVRTTVDLHRDTMDWMGASKAGIRLQYRDLLYGTYPVMYGTVRYGTVRKSSSPLCDGASLDLQYSKWQRNAKNSGPETKQKQ